MRTLHKFVLIVILSSCWLSFAQGADADWRIYLGGKERQLYSPLEQINRRLDALPAQLARNSVKSVRTCASWSAACDR